MKRVIIATAASLAATMSVQAAETLNFTMGSISGSVYAIGVQVGEELKKEGDYNVNVKAGGAMGNAIQVGSNKAQFGHTSTGLGFAALNGAEPFKKPSTELRAVGTVMESSFQFMSLKDVPVSSLAELKEKKYPLKLAVGPRGRENELLTRRVLEENGISYEDIQDWGGRVEFVAISDANSLIRDGHLEAVTMLSGLPYAPLTEINSARPMKMLEISGKTIGALSEKYGYVPTEIPSGTYAGIDAAVPSVAGGVVLVTNTKVSDETAYRMAKAVCSDEGRQRLSALSGSIKSYLTSAQACASGTGVPLHDGAKKYFDEIGVKY
ncbi:TAXI family TRAP transporter solute-binding subunit [Rhodobacteraceae bacterium RKSG542]|uniref:TAXI family TRAP transporter solute-binding subunit n=1 Tax=Pseudovibrio flavus TaxID=2529854 RepID=UPI0012BC352E|nr:TAXI family TRAP transporter solute-binding subunit [Pseudovibrio flavus]MTI17654.1 TAXI family TRAP transporter solute-binding subunit [Pseudovibrio flavus]